MVGIRLFDDFEVLMDGAVQTVHNSYPGFWVEEGSAIKYLYQRIVEKPHAVMVDIGAHVGTYTLLTAFCKNLHVYSVEPLESARETLSTNILFNQVLSQVRALAGVAISDTKEQKAFIHDEGRTQHSCIDPGPFYMEDHPRIRVECITLDDLFKWLKIPKADFIKIDAEGHEHKILLGGEHTIKKHMPDLLVECDEPSLQRFDTDSDNVKDYLRSLGYEHMKPLNGSDWYFSAKEIP